MFQQGNYEVLTFQMPIQGMNQFISPDILPPKFSYLLENIIPNPIGVGTVRYGTRYINSLAIQDYKILKKFPFVKQDGKYQAVLYVQAYTQDEIDNAAITNYNQLNFDSENNANRYIVNTTIKINYTLDGANYVFYPVIASVTIVGTTVEITLSDGYFPEGGVLEIQNISYAVGEIYVYDFEDNIISDPLITGLSVACIPRYAPFQQSIVICNGVDKMMSWDGNTLEAIYDFVKETKVNTSNTIQAFTRIDANNFSFNTIQAFDETKYFDGNLIQLKVNGASSTLTIEATDLTAAVFTITTEEALPAWGAGDQVELFYRDWPPAFNYIFAGNDRLWALGPGAAGIAWRSAQETLKLYYAYRPNSITNWFNENSKIVPYIDTSDKHGIQDNLEAICQVNGLTGLIGRKRTQVWSGTIPGQGGDFTWVSNVDTGAAHGDLVINVSNDTYFISQSGLQSFSTLNSAKQFAASSANAVDPIINDFLKNAMGSDIDYRACTSFKYEQGNLGGFKIGRNKLLVSLFQNNFYAWTFFSGDFQRSQAFLDVGNALYLAIDNKIYQYADGNDGSGKLYGDNNGTSLVSFSWVPGLVKIKGGSRRFANKRYQLIVDYPSSFPLNDANVVNLRIDAYIPKSFYLTDECNFQNKGDSLGEVPLGDFRLFQSYSFFNKRFKFVSAGFWVKLNGYTLNGPLSFKELKLFGIGERSNG